jgi:hypothetical protein
METNMKNETKKPSEIFKQKMGEYQDKIRVERIISPASIYLDSVRLHSFLSVFFEHLDSGWKKKGEDETKD